MKEFLGKGINWNDFLFPSSLTALDFELQFSSSINRLEVSPV